MLERIINITAGSDYRQSTRPSSRQINAYRHFAAFSSSANDSVLLSPATAFLSSVHWKLKKVIRENEKILIVFSFDEFEFSTGFYISELTANYEIDYDIKYRMELYPGVFDVDAKIGVALNEKNENLQVKENLDSLRGFLKTVFQADYEVLTNLSDDDYVKKIFADMEYQLHQEFNYINDCLINFIEKYLSIKLNIKNENTNAGSAIALKFLQLKKI